MAKKAAVIRDNSIQEADDSEVDVEMVSPVRLLGTHTNMIPLANTVQTTRSFYGSRMINQAMPLKDPEQPLVQILNPETGESFEKEYGESMGARMWRSDKGGTVKSVKPDRITVTDDAGEDHDVDLYDNFEFNRKTSITNRPVVKPGDKVQPGQLLAASNYTDDNGVVSMGKNARVALVPYKGYSMDDAIVVSESFAKRMTSLHSYESAMQKDDNTKFGKVHYSSLFPSKFTKEQLENMDDNGVVKPGTVLHKGDPIILATRPKTVTSNTEALGKLGKLFRTMRNDAAEVWEHDYPGYVTGNADGRKNVKAFITAQVPLKVGDKLIGARPGQKCYHPDTEIFTDRGWVKIADLYTDDKVACLRDFYCTGRIEYLYACMRKPLCYTYHRFDGELYGMEADDAAYLVTGNHRVLCSLDGGITYRTVDASELHGADTVGFVTEVPFISEADSAGMDTDAFPRGTQRVCTAGADSFYRQEYHGTVYCVQVPGQGDVLTRYHGKVMWNGNSIVSKIIPDEQILRSLDGRPFEVLLNPLALPSRINTSTLHELALGKVAAKTGKPIALPTFPDGKEDRLATTYRLLKEAGVSPTEEVFDPVLNRKLAKPVSTGTLYAYKLHHVVESKKSARGQGAYSQDEAPVKGGGENAQAKRLGGLEVTALLSKGGIATLREAMTLRGQCFDTSTEVLTRRGWVHWGEVLSTDELYTKNKDLDSNTWFERPLHLIENYFEGELYGYEGKHLNWLVTPNHNLWGVPHITAKSKSYYKARLYTAKSVYNKDGIIDSFGSVYTGTLLDDYVVTFNGADWRSKSISMTLYDYCVFMGWYLSEGCCNIDENGRGRIRISQAKQVNPSGFSEIEDILHRIGFSNVTYEHKHKNFGKNGGIAAKSTSPAGTPVTLRVYSAPLAKHLKQFGDRAWLKRIPDIIFEASPRARRAFIEAYTKGDGCVRKTTFSGAKQSSNVLIGTTSPYMVEGLQRLAILTGYAAWTGLEKRAGLQHCKHDYYRVIISENVTTQTFRKKPADRYLGHYKVPYTGKVYCATMRTGLLYVRRNGKCMWSGNSNDDYWRTVRQGYKPSDPGVPFVFNKFLYLLNGAGMNVQDKGRGTLRLKLFTDRDLREKAPRMVLNGGMIKPDSLEGDDGGLFDKNLVAHNSWGFIPLSEPMVNPAAEPIVLQLLGLKEKDFRKVLAGEMDIDEAGGIKGRVAK